MTAFQMARRLFLAPVTGVLYFLASRGLPDRLADVPYDKALYLWTPTYDGSAQAVHPDILETGSGPNGSSGEYVLAMTPYPYSIDEFENPSVLVSADGLRFREEARGTNPAAPKPAMDHNDDPDLSIIDGRYILYYLETMRPDRQNLVMLESADRRSWIRRAAFEYELGGKNPDPLIVSPALVEMNGSFRLFYVNASADPCRVEYLESGRPDSWDKRSARPAVIEGLDEVPWHLDVVGGGGWHYMLLTTRSEGEHGNFRYDLRVARSRDLATWSMSREPAVASKPLGCRSVYRSSALVKDGDLFIYFSYETAIHEWRIALERRRIADLFK